MILYGADLSSPSNKVRFVANALNLEYSYKKVQIRLKENRTPEFLKLHPAGKIPVIDDEGFILFESNAIIKYLAVKTGSSLYPPEKRRRARIDQWLDFCSFHIGAAMNRVVFNRLFAPRIPVAVDERSLADGLDFLNRFLPVVENQLVENRFLEGNSLTLADFNLLSILDPAELAGVDLGPCPKLLRWRKDLQGKDFYTKCYRQYGEALTSRTPNG